MGRGRQNWRQRKETRPDRAFYSKGKPWRKDQEEEWKRQNKDGHAGEPEVRECQRYTYRKGELVQVAKVEDDLDKPERVETNNVDGLDREDESTVDQAVQIIGSDYQEEPKVILNSQEVPEVKQMDLEVPYALDTGVLRGQAVSDICRGDHQEAKETFDCQEVPGNASKVIEKEHDQTEAMKISDCVNELVKNIECLAVPEEANKFSEDKPDGQEKAEKIFEELEKRLEIQEERTGCKELLEKRRLDLVEKLEHCVKPELTSNKLDGEMQAESQKSLRERQEGLEGGQNRAEDQKAWREKDGTQGNMKMLITEQSCANNLERNEVSTGRAEETPEFPRGLMQEAMMEPKAERKCSSSKEKVNRDGETMIMDNKLESCSDGGNIELPSSDVKTNANKALIVPVREGSCSEPDGRAKNEALLEMETASSEQTQPTIKGEEGHEAAANPAVDEVHISMLKENCTDVKPLLYDSCTESVLSDTHQTSDKEAEEQSVTECSNPSNDIKPTLNDECADDDQQRIMKQIMAEIGTHLSEKDVHIQPLLGNFSEFAETQVEHGRFGHIIEVYSFSSKLGTEDLMEPFQEYRERGFRLHWVDQTHALAIFSSPEEAYAASRRTHPDMKFRPLSQGSRQSKIRAYDKAASMQPPRDRPPTDASVAKRMVNRALGQPKCQLEQSVE